MADYYVDFEGNISQKKKKKKQNTVSDYSVDFNGNVRKNLIEVPEKKSPTPLTTFTSQQGTPNTSTTVLQADRKNLQKQAEQNVVKQFGTYEEFAKKNSTGKVAATAEAANKISQTTYKKLIEEETNRLASGSEFYGITNEGYREYLDNFSRNAKDDKQKKWLETQKKNLEMLKDEKIRSKVEGAVYANKTSMKKNDGSLIYALSKQLKISYEQAESLYDTVKREQNAKHSQTMLDQVDKMTDQGVLGKAGAQFLSVGANMTSTLGFLESLLQNGRNAVQGKYEPLDTNNFAYMSGKARDKIRGNIEADIEGDGDSILRKGLGILYQGATSSFDSLSQGLLLGPTGGLAAMASQAAGGATVEAFERTGSNAKALGTGLTSGLIEAATEKMGLDNMWDILQNSGKAAMRSKLVNVLGQMAIEAGEEMTSEVANTIADRIINTTDSNWTQNKKSYMDSGMSEKEAFKKTMGDTVQQVLLAGAGGAAGGLFGGISSTLLSTEFTKNEQKVIDAEVDARVAEKAKDGKVSAKQKSAIRKAVESDLAKGYIGIDTIEKTLGGDTLQKYNSVVEQEETLTKQLKELGEKPNTVANAKQYEELSAKLKELQEKGEKNTLKEQLSKEVSDLTENDRFLRESYNEKGRRSQAFEADVSRYQKNQQETIQRAIDSGILNNTNVTHEFVDWIAKISADKGVSFDFTNNEKLKESGFAKEGVSVNGYVADGNVVLNVNSAKALNQVVGHEITHVLEGSELYTELQEAVKAYATTKGEYQSKLEALSKVYEGMEGVNVEQELIADLIGEYLFTDEAFVQQLSTQNRNIFQKIYDEIKYLLKTVTAGSKEARQLEKVKKVFEEAYREDVKVEMNTNVQYSLVGRDENGIEVYETSEDTKQLSYAERKAKLLDIMRNEYAGRTAKFTKNGETYYAQYNVAGLKKGVYGDKKSDLSGYNAKINIGADGNYIELAENALYTGSSEEQGKSNAFHKDAQSWDYYEKTIQSDGKYYDVLINVKDTGNNQYVYDITLKEATHQYALKHLRLGEAASKSSIPQNQQNATGNQKFSLSKDIDGMSEMEYNHHGWAKINDVLTQQELADFQQKVGEKAKNGQNWYMNLEDGRYMFAVGQDGVNSTLIISDGDFQHPSIEKVYQINADNETDIEVIRDGIYRRESKAYRRNDEAFNREKKGKWSQSSNAVEKMLRDGLISEYRKSDFFTLRELRGYDGGIGTEGEGNTGGYGNLPNGRGSNQKTRIDFSLSDKVSSDDGIFFDGENADGWNVRGKDIALEDIGPVRKDIVQEEKTEWELLEEWLRESQEADKVSDVQQVEKEPTIKQRNKEKLEKYESKLESIKESAERRISKNEELIAKREIERRDLKRSYDAKIAAKREQYEAKKNKDTKAANALLSQMHNLESRKETRLSECDRDIQYYNSEIAYIREELSDRSQRLQERIEKMNSAEFKTAEQRQMKQEETRTFIQELIGDTSTWKDKKMGISYQMRTLRRNLRDIVRDSNGNPDYARADAIYDAIQGTYNRNEATLNREANQIKEKFRSMKINKAEDAYIQMLGEYRHNPDTTLTADVMDRYYKAHKDKIDMAKVETAIEEVRKVYDSLFYRTNQVLKEHGFKEMGYREGYFPHFTENKSKAAKFFEKVFNWKTQDNSIPTDIAGLTEQFTPNRSYQSFDKHRTSDTTDYSFMKGLDTYVNGALDWIYHIEDIQRRRALENEIRYVHSDAGVQEKLDAIYKNEEYDADQMQEEIDKVLKEKNNPLNNFVSDLRKGTQNLAGKKDTADRGLENRTSRKIYSVMTNISNRTTANMVVGSISSATTNLIPITQSWGQVSPLSSLYGMEQTIKSYIHDDGVVNQSDFLTNRLRQNENLYKTGWDKAGNALGIMMDVVDNFTSQTVWRSKYFENIKQGMSESEAIKNADQFAENLLAGRSRGNMPTIFNEKNPVTKVFTAFQLEVMNQYEYMFKDMPQDLKAESSGNMQLAGKLVKGYAGMYVGAYLYNALMSQLTGRDAAFDPIGILVDFLRDLGAFDDDDDEDEESGMMKTLGIYDDEVDKSYLQAVKNLAGNVADEIPFIGGLLGGGRIPISSAIPYDNPVSMVSESVTELAKIFDEDKDMNWKKLTEEWTKPLTYLVMPMGGGQLRKTAQGLSMFSKDKEVTGSYTTSGKLRFPVEDTVGNRIKAGFFGQYANENAREYFDEERQPLSEKKTKEFAELDIPISEYWSIQDGMKNLTKIGEKADYIAGLDLPVEKKNILINNQTTRDDPIDLTDYSLYNDLDEMDFAIKNPGKYSIAKATGGYEAYKGYQKALNNIHANKDSNGNAISGSRKEKVIDYLNGLTVDYGTRMILYRQQFNGDSTYNQQIVEYLDSREDMSYSEKEKILTELGFTVEADGTVRWKK